MARRKFTPAADRARDYADADPRPWGKVEEFATDLEDYTQHADTFVSAVESLRSALDEKEGAMELGGMDRADALATAWDSAVDALSDIAEALEFFTDLFVEGGQSDG